MRCVPSMSPSLSTESEWCPLPVFCLGRNTGQTRWGLWHRKRKALDKNLGRLHHLSPVCGDIGGVICGQTYNVEWERHAHERPTAQFWLFVGSFLTLTAVGIIVQLFGKKMCKVRPYALRHLFHMRRDCLPVLESFERRLATNKCFAAPHCPHHDSTGNIMAWHTELSS